MPPAATVFDPASVAIDSALTLVANPDGMSFIRVDLAALGDLLRPAVVVTATVLKYLTEYSPATVGLFAALPFHITDAELFKLLDTAGGVRSNCLPGGWRRNGAHLSAHADKCAKVAYNGITAPTKRLAKATSILAALDTAEARAEVRNAAVASALLSVTSAVVGLSNTVRDTAIWRYADPTKYAFVGAEAEALAPTLLAEMEALARMETAKADWRAAKDAVFAQKRALVLASVKACDYGVLPDGVFEAIHTGLTNATLENSHGLS